MPNHNRDRLDVYLRFLAARDLLGYGQQGRARKDRDFCRLKIFLIDNPVAHRLVQQKQVGENGISEITRVHTKGQSELCLAKSRGQRSGGHRHPGALSHGGFVLISGAGARLQRRTGAGYNDWLRDRCSADPKRLKGAALIPLHVDVKAAIEEMERAIGELGFVGVMLNTFDRTRNVAHRDFWPFCEECAWHGVPVSFRASGSDMLDPVCHFDNFLSAHTLSHVPE
jgi:hypothetical protein